MDYFPEINPMNSSVYPMLDGISVSSPVDKKQAVAQFTSIFLKQIFKQIVASDAQDSFFGSNDVSFFNDLMAQKISQDLAEKNIFGFEDLIAKGL